MVALWSNATSARSGNILLALLTVQRLQLHLHFSITVGDVSSQCTPSDKHCSTQTGDIPPICNCKCALEVSQTAEVFQLKQEVLDIKVQLKNQLKVIHNAV